MQILVNKRNAPTDPVYFYKGMPLSDGRVRVWPVDYNYDQRGTSFTAVPNVNKTAPGGTMIGTMDALGLEVVEKPLFGVEVCF